ncbi:MFS transporter [Janibacter alittae]|uniref:MFS transporter n=1 Tax=Janibacter alittae TaxID=3115209 RepID=A0ABZ2MD74_9MICO
MATPLFTRGFIALSVSELGYFTAAGMAVFALPLYVTGPHLAGDEVGAGLAVGIFAISALALRPVAGRLTDTVGRRPLLLGGAMVATACFGLLPLTDSLALVLVVRLLAGLGEAAFVVAGFAALADLAPPERMGEALSYNSLGLYLGMALGPVLAEALVRAGGFTTVWVGAAGITALAAAVASLVGETRVAAAPEEVAPGFIHRPALAVALGFLASLAAMGGFIAFVSLYATSLGLENASIALFVFGGVVVLCRTLLARVPDRVPPLTLGASSLGAIALGLMMAAAVRHPLGLLAGIVVMAVGVAFSTPAFFSAIFATATPSERGVASATATAAIDLGLGIGPIALGLVASGWGIPWAFAAGSAIAALGAVWILTLRQRADQREVSSSS